MGRAQAARELMAVQAALDLTIWADIFDSFSAVVSVALAEAAVLGTPTDLYGVTTCALLHRPQLFGSGQRLYQTAEDFRLETCKTCGGTGAKNADAIKTCPDCHGSGQVR